MISLQNLGEPYFVNEQGTRYWLEECLTDYAKNPDLSGVCLPSHRAWLVQLKDGEYTYLLTEGTTPVYEGKSIEQIAVRIDMLKAIVKFDKSK